ncbi:ABC transporter ATP-binding protein [Lactiplantibacillus plantarum]|nr:ABC transporter ATP-binding protein [Lactiplantibacillus plantarum]
MVNTILKEADLFCPNSVRINFTIYQILQFITKTAYITSTP